MREAETYIRLLKQMLAIPALSRDEDTRADFLEAWLEKLGLTVQRLHNNLIVCEGKLDAATILMNSHIDTVKPADGWESDPFLPKEQGDQIFGLGSNDAGASVVSLIAAYVQMKDLGLHKNIALVLSAEEEVSGKKGIEAVLPLLPKLEFGVVGEPTRMRAAVAERGLMVVDAVSKGKAGHAARREGDNAIYHALEDISVIKSLSFPSKSDYLDDPTVSVTMISAGKNHNVIPDRCEFVIDVRSNDKYRNEALFDLLQSTCKAELTARSMRLGSSWLDEANPLSKVLKKLKIETFGSPTLSDMALLPFPAVKMGPGDSARSHTANEYIEKTEIEAAIDGYTVLMKEILNALK
jgi:acetylornithine deacetylase